MQNTGTAVDFAPLVSSLAQLLFVVVATAIAAYAQKHVKNADARTKILAAIDNGVAFGMNRVGGALAGKTLDVNLGSSVAAQAVRYAMATVPDAVAHLGLDEAHLAKIAVAKLPAVDGEISDDAIHSIVTAAGGHAPPMPTLQDALDIIRKSVADGSLKIPVAS